MKRSLAWGWAMLMCSAPTIAQTSYTEAYAKGFDMVDGAIVCPNYNLTDWITREIDQARHARKSLPAALRKQFALVDGYDMGDEPNPRDYQCVLVPPGTPMNVQKQNYVPVVSGKLTSGEMFHGVTLDIMIGH